MSTIVTRLGKGKALTWQEADANFTNLNLDKVEESELASSTGSSMVGYLPDGTGAVTTTIQDKLRESVSVKDFGAVGDGVTDDTVAIQAAINSGAKYITSPSGLVIRITATVLIDTNSVTLDFNKSELLLDDPTGLKDHIKIGNGTTQRYSNTLKGITFTRQQAATDGAAINTDYVGVLTIKDCSIWGNNEIYDGIRIYKGTIVNIENNNITNCVHYGIILLGGDATTGRTVDTSIRENRVEGCVNALNTWDFVEGMFCRDNIFYNTSNSAVSVNASTNANGLISFKFQENDFDTCGGNGLFIDKVSNVQVTGNWFSNTTGIALDIGSAVDGCLVTDNQIYPANHGVRLAGNATRVSTNLISGGLTSIVVMGTATRTGILGNQLAGAQYGIDITGNPTNTHITSNDVFSMSSGVINGSGGVGTVIQGNKGDSSVGSNGYINVGASPFTYTAGVRPEYVAVFGGTVSQIAMSGAHVSFQSNMGVVLAPGQSITVTYSSTPFMMKNSLL